MITWTRFQARLNVATEWSRSRLAPLQLYAAYGLWQLFISPIRRTYAGEPYSAMPRVSSISQRSPAPRAMSPGLSRSGMSWPFEVPMWYISRARAARVLSNVYCRLPPQATKCCQIAGCLPVRASKSEMSEPAVTPFQTLPFGGAYGNACALAGRQASRSRARRSPSRFVMPVISAQPCQAVIRSATATAAASASTTRLAFSASESPRAGG